MVDKLIDIINKLKIPKVILRYIMMNFLDLTTINNLLFVVKEMNVLDTYSKNLLVNTNKGFIWNCENGNLVAAQWICSSKQSLIDIHAYECAFQMACAHGHLTVAQWLYSLDLFAIAPQGRVNIHAFGDYAFRMCYSNGHLPVAKWLYSLGGIKSRKFMDLDSID